jgi:hypothetical protein
VLKPCGAHCRPAMSDVAALDKFGEHGVVNIICIIGFS